MRDKPASMYGISRNDNDENYTHAWIVSLKRGGRKHVKRFPDRKCGGKAKALRLAQAFRDKLVRRYRPITRQEWANRLRRNNQSGVVGVSRYVRHYERKNGIQKYWIWSVTYPTNVGRKKTVQFPVSKYGEKGAFERACIARQLGMQAVDGYFWRCQ